MSLYIALGIIVCVLIILFVPVKITVTSENILLYRLKFLFWKFDISVEEILSKKGVFGIDFILSFLLDLKRFLRERFTVKRFNLTVDVGTEEAASTAVITGYVYGLAYSILSLIDQFLKVIDPKVSVNPHFNSVKLSMSLVGIIKTRIVHIIATAIIFAYKFFKYKKEENKEEN